MSSLEEILYDDVDLVEDGAVDSEDEDLQESNTGEGAINDENGGDSEVTKRYFVLKFLNYDNIAQTFISGIWKPKPSALKVLELIKSSLSQNEVILIFTIENSEHFHGYGLAKQVVNNNEALLLSSIKISFVSFDNLSDVFQNKSNLSFSNGEEIDINQAENVISLLDQNEVDNLNELQMKIYKTLVEKENQNQIQNQQENQNQESSDDTDNISSQKKHNSEDEQDEVEDKDEVEVEDEDDSTSINQDSSELIKESHSENNDPEESSTNKDVKRIKTDDSQSRGDNRSRGDSHNRDGSGGGSSSHTSNFNINNNTTTTSRNARSTHVSRNMPPHDGSMGGGGMGMGGGGMGMGGGGMGMGGGGMGMPSIRERTFGMDITEMSYDEYRFAYDRQCYAIAMERMMMSQQGVGGVGVGGGPMGMAMGGGVGGGGGGGGGPMGGMGMSHPMMAMPGAMPYYNAGPGMMPGHGMGMGMGMGLPMRQGMGAAAVGRGDWSGQGQGQGYRRDQQGARR